MDSRPTEIPTRKTRPPVAQAALGVGVVVQDERGRILLGRHHGGTWELPGGKVDPTNESIAAAAVRELREETGLDVTEDRVTVFAMLHDVVAGINRVTMAAVVTVQSENPQVTEPHLISTWEWTGLDDLPEPLFDPSAQILAAWRPELPVEHPPAHCLKVMAVPAGADS
ncbi:nucleotide triphosphate diphosphatase NUDT15 [Streptomyces sp. NBC_00724]|uniref:nucleotide triphosphate diphosphatase NUDT15 n=1 Tax=Streptomyces sp. NBC_00724 TaxID=2975812 RepID=UPI002ED463BE|nr:NUDIX domain-containing protein [Streptomyces sp. NBC_00724]